MSISDVLTEAWLDDLDFPCIPEGHLESQSRGVTDATHSPAELNPFWEAPESLSVQGQIELISVLQAAAWGSLSLPGSLLSSFLCVTLAWPSVRFICSALPRLGWETPQAHGIFLFVLRRDRDTGGSRTVSQVGTTVLGIVLSSVEMIQAFSKEA